MSEEPPPSPAPTEAPQSSPPPDAPIRKEAFGRRQFILLLVALALGAIGMALADWSRRMRRAHSAIRRERRAVTVAGVTHHPESRAGITSAHVLADAAIDGNTEALAAYAAARAIPEVFDALWCGCSCRESMGHRSLLACYESRQPLGCGSCREEAVMVKRLHDAGRSIQEIRARVDEKFM
jgi:hypothetical protein